MTPEQFAALRKPFDPSVIGKLPRAGISLDYVGHATVTDRLLEVDPEWTWEPFAVADDGGPLIRQSGKNLTLWIRLTIAGVTRLGVGSVADNAFDAEKQLIGDALRNAAMRFGVALDLWSKNGLESEHDYASPEDTVDWFVANGWDGGKDEHDERLRALKEVLRGLDSDAQTAFREWRTAAGIDLGKALTRGELDTADAQAAELVATAPWDRQAPQPPATPQTATQAPLAANGDHPACSLCGSTRAELAEVDGTLRCAKPGPCAERARLAGVAP